MSPPGSWPAAATFPIGVFRFTVTGVTAGGSAAVTLIDHSAATVNTYFKFGSTQSDPADHWYEFRFDGTTGAALSSSRATLHLVDGQRGDDDLTANGSIVDPGGPAFLPPPTPTPTLRPTSGTVPTAESTPTGTPTFIVANTNDSGH